MIIFTFCTLSAMMRAYMAELVLVIHNVRSTHNVGSLLRTANGLGLKRVYLSGYTPHFKTDNDLRLPHVIAKDEKRIQKTSLGAHKGLEMHYLEDLTEVISNLRADNFHIIGLEQHAQSQILTKFTSDSRLALIVGNEVDGIDPSELSLVDTILEIPMRGTKESLNVSVAGALALFYLQDFVVTV